MTRQRSVRETRVAPGVGLIWLRVRREWRQLGIGLGVTAVLVAIGPTQRSYIARPA